jgi:nucleotide-binding universal stress UspA family protein
VDDEHLHIEEGPADVLIRSFRTSCRRRDGDRHRGAHRISGALIGNTAEVVLDAVESDVLVLKPESLMIQLEKLAGKR